MTDTTPPFVWPAYERPDCQVIPIPLDERPTRRSLSREITAQVQQHFAADGRVYAGPARQCGKTAWAEHVRAGLDMPPDAGVIRYETDDQQRRRAEAHSRELRRLTTPGEIVVMGTRRDGVRRYLVAEHGTAVGSEVFADDRPPCVLLALPHRWEGDDS